MVGMWFFSLVSCPWGTFTFYALAQIKNVLGEKGYESVDHVFPPFWTVLSQREGRERVKQDSE